MKELLKKGAFEVSNASANASQSYIRAVFKKQAIVFLLQYLKAEYCDLTFKKRAKKILFDSGYYTLTEISKRLDRPKQTVFEWSKKVKDDVYIIELGERKFYSLSNFI